MAQHMLLLVVAPPLIVYGRPLLAFVIGCSVPTRRVLQRFEHRLPLNVLGHPAVVWTAYTGVLWTWHLPGLYQAAVGSSGVHVLEHAMFLGVALLLWGTVIGAGTRRRVTYGAALALAFTTMLPSVWLAMIISFAPHPLYPVYGSLSDQQFAGAVMWAPMALGSMVTVGVLVLRFIRMYDMRFASRTVDA